jgi:predicted TIM-barrel fold metal-dependent hydrolase
MVLEKSTWGCAMTLAEVAQQKLGYAAFDADGHYYEPHDAFTRHLESKYADRSLHVVMGDDGLGRLWFGDRKCGMMKVTQTDYTGSPGSRMEFFQTTVDDGEGWRQTDVISAHDHPPMMNKAARLQLMDEQGIEATLMFPTVGVAVEDDMHHDLEAMNAAYRAFNRWLEEDWGYGDDGRIYGVPMIPLVDPDDAAAELHRVLERGARLVYIKRGPLYGDSPASPSRDRFWGLAQEADIPVAFHTGNAGYNEQWATAWGEPPAPPLQYTSPFTSYLGGTTTQDTFANLILNNLFERFPNLKIMSIENGCGWVPELMKRMDKAVAFSRKGTGLGGLFTAPKASDVFLEHFYVAPFFEEDPVWLIERMGADHVLFGSDWPHPEGLDTPLNFADKLVDRVDDDTLRKVMRSNVAELVKHGR